MFLYKCSNNEMKKRKLFSGDNYKNFYQTDVSNRLQAGLQNFASKKREVLAAVSKQFF
jgi:hypothetical protein